MQVKYTMRICLSTGIYNDIGGVSRYVKKLEKLLPAKVITYKGRVRHFFSILFDTSDVYIVFDTFSACVPTVFACMLKGKRPIIRIGGDFLWESYVNRTKQKVLLKDFYFRRLSIKEYIIYYLTYICVHYSHIIWTTQFQKDIWSKAYNLNKGDVIPNVCEKRQDTEYNDMIICSGRKNIVKNILPVGYNGVYDTDMLKNCYAVVVPSLSDVSPNTIFEAIQYTKPFIVTTETGIHDLIKDIAIFYNPLTDDIHEKIQYLKSHHSEYVEKLKQFNYVYTWEQYVDDLFRVVTTRFHF